jgi:hypothetical protein
VTAFGMLLSSNQIVHHLDNGLLTCCDPMSTGESSTSGILTWVQ